MLFSVLSVTSRKCYGTSNDMITTLTPVAILILTTLNYQTAQDADTKYYSDVELQNET